MRIPYVELAAMKGNRNGFSNMLSVPFNRALKRLYLRALEKVWQTIEWHVKSTDTACSSARLS